MEGMGIKVAHATTAPSPKRPSAITPIAESLSHSGNRPTLFLHIFLNVFIWGSIVAKLTLRSELSRAQDAQSPNG